MKTNTRTTWFCVVLGLVSYFIGAFYAAEPTTITEEVGILAVILGVGLMGFGAGNYRGKEKSYDTVSDNRNIE